MRLAPEETIPSLKDKLRGTVGDFALHIQCPWRIENNTGIITGRADLWEPLERSPEFSYDDWDYEDGNIQDQRIDQFLSANTELFVESLSIESHGSFTLALSGGYKLMVFPSGSTGEDWRFFRPGSGESHLVVSGGAIER